MQYVDVAARLILVTVFALAFASKVAGRAAWAAFVKSLRDMAVVPERLVPAAAVAAAAAEAAVVLVALVPVRVAGTVAFVLAAGLMAALTLAVTAVVRRGAAVACRCFGATTAPLGTAHIVRNALLLGVSLLGLAGSFVDGSVQWGLAAIVGLFGLVIGFVVTRWDDLAALV
ncbi:MauE/DoxX family redox-associated membrane protein [Hamadaea tsunoensis]|uniref:MauE/DoxX family redox-associated membrane protein n=1 Tax=Hamadaea tsunoensis TaxID=53368 RepID=UPI0003FC1338|nr:MauE/DoxX family redox-associated membrane protein [Hamadaea tsunoensis]